jgi:hypothetical protein
MALLFAGLVGAQEEMAPAPVVAESSAVETLAPLTTGCASCAAGSSFGGGCDTKGKLDCWCGEIPCNFSRWSVRLDYLHLRRSTQDSFAYLTGLNVPANQLFFRTTNDLEDEYQPGYRITLSSPVSDTSVTEVTYFGSTDFDRTDAFAGDANNTILPTLTPLTTVAASVARYRTTFDSLEINYRRYLSVFPHTSFLIGLRGLRVDEEFGVNEAGTINAVAANAFRAQRTRNSLLGVQIGGDVMYQPTCRFQWGGYGRVGAFGNWHRGTIQTGQTTGLAGAQSFTDRDSEISFMSEFGLMASYQVGENVLLRGGYHVTYLTDLALAPFQTEGVGQYTVDADQDAWWHGPFAGVEFRWGRR